MRISIIAALDERGGIGKDNRLPWHLSADLKRFKTLTMGHHLIVGRKTCQSIGRPLPGRKGIVITRDPRFEAPGYTVAHSLEQALSLARQRGENEAFIAGGAAIYALALPLADRMYLTRVHTIAEADTFFPPFDPAAWKLLQNQRHPADEKNEFDFTVQVWERGAKPSRDV